MSIVALMLRIIHKIKAKNKRYRAFSFTNDFGPYFLYPILETNLCSGTQKNFGALNY